MKARTRKHAGRTFRQVARGHVVDVATGVEIEIEPGRSGFSLRPPGAVGFYMSGAGPYTVKSLLERFANAADVCMFVRVLVEIAGITGRAEVLS